MNKQRPFLPYCYAVVTIACTFLVGRLILWRTPDGTKIWASLLFILMNLLPMLVAFVFVRISGEMTGIWDIIKAAFRPQESWRAYAAALAAPLVYYGGSSLLAWECDLHGFSVFGGDCVFPLDAFAGRPGRSGVAVVSAIPYRNEKKLCAENARRFLDLVRMASSPLSPAMGYCGFVQFPCLFPDDTGQQLYPWRGERMVPGRHPVHSGPYVDRRGGGLHACGKRFDEGGAAGRRGNCAFRARCTHLR